MNAPPQNESPSCPAPDMAALSVWRDAAFWSLLLACLGGLAVLSLVADREMLRPLELLTTHAEAPRRIDFPRIALVTEHTRWWILALPLGALLLRWVPLGGGRSSKKPVSQEGASRVAGKKKAEVSAPEPTPGEEVVPSRMETGPVGRSGFVGFPCPGFVVGFFALQLCVGAGFLTGSWTYISDRFWAIVPATDDEIRAESLPHGTLTTSRRLEKILPPDAKVYVVTDMGAQPIFLNYYLYPRRFYSSEAAEGFMEETDKAAFWEARRREGFEWVFLFRPGVDPVSGGALLRLDRTSSTEPNMSTGKERAGAR